jgi:hypothetical protein
MGAWRRRWNGVPVDVDQTPGFLVADARGRPVGHVECPMYGTAPEVPDALAVRSGHVIQRHYIVPAAAIGEIDGQRRVVGLTLRRSELQRFL